MQSNISRNSFIFVRENPVKNVVWKITAIWSRPFYWTATELIDRISNNIDGKMIDFAIVMDLYKLFGMLDHNILIDKLQQYGIRGISLM